MTRNKSNDHVIPHAQIERLIRRTTHPARVSKSAAKEMASILEHGGIDLAMRAADLAEHANRKTVQECYLALKKLPEHTCSIANLLARMGIENPGSIINAVKRLKVKREYRDDLFN